MSKIQKKRFWVTCDDDGCSTAYYGVSSEPGALEKDGGLHFSVPFMGEEAVQHVFGITLERGEQVQLEITVRELPPEEDA